IVIGSARPAATVLQQDHPAVLTVPSIFRRSFTLLEFGTTDSVIKRSFSTYPATSPIPSAIRVARLHRGMPQFGLIAEAVARGEPGSGGARQIRRDLLRALRCGERAVAEPITQMRSIAATCLTRRDRKRTRLN